MDELLAAERELVDAYYRSDVWRPHCTMAINVPEARISAVTSACRARDVLGEVRVTRLQLVRYRPATEVWSAELGEGTSA